MAERQSVRMSKLHMTA